MSTYHVTATREGRYWVLDIEGIGVTQARHLAELENMVSDHIRLDLGPEAIDDLHLEVNIVVQGLEDEVAAVREERQEAIDAQARAAARSREVARKLKDAGLTGADAARVMGVSSQRMSQLTSRANEQECVDAQPIVGLLGVDWTPSRFPGQAAPNQEVEVAGSSRSAGWITSPSSVIASAGSA